MKDDVQKAVTIEVAHNSTIWCTTQPDKPVVNTFTLFISLEPYSDITPTPEIRIPNAAGGGDPTVTITEPEFCSFLKNHTLTPSGKLIDNESPWVVTVGNDTVTIEYEVDDLEQYPVADYLPYCFFCDDFVMYEDDTHKIGWHRCSYSTSGFHDSDTTIREVTASAWYQVKEPVDLTFNGCAASEDAMCVKFKDAAGQTYYVTGIGEKLFFNYDIKTQGNTNVGVYFGEELLSADTNTAAAVNESGTYVIRADNGYIKSFPVRVIATDWKYYECDKFPEIDFSITGQRIFYDEKDKCYYIYAGGIIYGGTLNENNLIEWSKLIDFGNTNKVFITDFYQAYDTKGDTRAFYVFYPEDDSVTVISYNFETKKTVTNIIKNTSIRLAEPLSVKVADEASLLMSARTSAVVNIPFDKTTCEEAGDTSYSFFKPEGSPLKHINIDTASFRNRIITAVLLDDGHIQVVPVEEGSSLDDLRLIDLYLKDFTVSEPHPFTLNATGNDLYLTARNTFYSFHTGQKEWFPGTDDGVIMGSFQNGLLAAAKHIETDEEGKEKSTVLLWYKMEEI